MNRSRTITLELLREGPPHNQLLSPLTRYLAACQNRPPESIRLSVEHRDFLRWQAALTYAGTNAPRRTASRDALQVERRNGLDDASQAVTVVLGSIRALAAELASEPCEWRHLHLIVDAAEVGVLPFELARAAPGLMVEGERLFMQQNARVTLSRQTRRVATSVISWPSRPRILCIVATGDLPLDAHVLALRKAIEPWIGWYDGDGQKTSEQDDDDQRLRHNRAREASEMITVLENPLLNEVSAVARHTCFTHVHVLAHGAPMPNADPAQALYGLCFRGDDGAIDVVDGDRLEASLRHTRHRECSHPTVVTLATCEGANLSGAILGPGGSAAHAIHAKGVPLVVASQFPLSKGASVIATEMLYRGLLRGEDPRETVHAIRRELIVAYPDTHDWASIVMYASFPPDLDSQLQEVRRAADKRAVETAVERFRVSIRQLKDSNEFVSNIDWRDTVAAEVQRLDDCFAVIEAWTEPANDAPTRIAGYRALARIALRLWDVNQLRSFRVDTPIAQLLQRPGKHDSSTGKRPLSMLAPAELLKLAKRSYETAFHLDASQWELWVQVIVLAWALKIDAVQKETRDRFNADLTATRYMASILAEKAAEATTNAQEQRAMAAAIGFEVELLALLAGHKPLHIDPGTDADEAPKATQEKKVRYYFNEFLDAAKPVSESYRAHAAWRQLRRYQQWIDPSGVKELQLITEFVEKLQEELVRTTWGPRN